MNRHGVCTLGSRAARVLVSGFGKQQRAATRLVVVVVMATLLASCAASGATGSHSSAKTRVAPGNHHLRSRRAYQHAVLPLSWHAVSPPKIALPAGVAATGFLSGISCVSEKFCVAVGGTSPGWPYALYPVGPSSNLVNAPSRLSYGPNGSYIVPNSFSETPSYLGNAVVESFNGTAWNDGVIEGSVPDAALSSVSCVSERFCVAVGPGPSGPYIVTFNGKAWKADVFSKKGIAAQHSVALNAVSCVSSRFCVAVGFRMPVSGPGNSSVDSQAVVENFDGKSWRVSTTAYKVAVPRAVPRIQRHSGVLHGWALNSVSCVTARFCVAVGQASPDNGAGGAFPIVDVFNGKTWRASEVPVAKKSTYLAADNGGVPGLVGVSCVSTSFCVAVGSWLLGPFHSGPSCNCPVAVQAFPYEVFDPVVDVFNGKTWSPVAPSRARWLVFDGISCLSRTFCAGASALGMYGVDQFTPKGALGPEYPAETFNGTRWRTSPIGLASPMNRLDLYAVSCAPAGRSAFCIATGSAYEIASGGWPDQHLAPEAGLGNQCLLCAMPVSIFPQVARYQEGVVAGSVQRKQP